MKATKGWHVNMLAYMAKTFAFLLRFMCVCYCCFMVPNVESIINLQFTQFCIVIWAPVEAYSEEKAGGGGVEHPAIYRPWWMLPNSPNPNPRGRPCWWPPNGDVILHTSPPFHILSPHLSSHHPHTPLLETLVSLLLFNGLLWTVNVNYHGRGCTYRLNVLCFPRPNGQLQCPMCNNVFSAKWTCCNISL